VNKNKPRVSIGLPVYNGENFLEEAINSLLGQTFENFEFIISDNGSTDKTRAICESYEARDERIRYYRNEKNRGAAWNYNYVFSLSNGVYFKWASHDDVLAAESLERCVEILDQNPTVVLCYPRTLIIDEYTNKIRKYDDDCHLTSPRPHVRFRHFISRASVECNAVFGIIRSSHLKKTNLIGSYQGADFILLANLALLGQFYEFPEELFFRRDHPETSYRANPTCAEVSAWYDPEKKKKIILVNWRWCVEYLRSIMRTQLDTIEGVLCLIELVNWSGRKTTILIRELISAAKQLLGNLTLAP